VSGDRGRAEARPYETIALNHRDWQIRLPTEWEWQWMVQGGARALEYPWGAWQEGYANTSEAGLSRTTAVGMYPHGRAECGALDVAGNLREWCLNDYESPETVSAASEATKVVRGGSFYLNQNNAAASYRNGNFPYHGVYYFGFRLVVSSPMRL
jgi:formylglycine-generating enzyme required for sulfatase activity